MDKKSQPVTIEIDLEEAPVITKRKIDTGNLRFAFDMQTRKLSIEFNYETQFSGDTQAQVIRKHMMLRNDDYDYAFDELFPNDDEVVWTNPQQTFLTSILNLIKNKGV